MKTGNTRLENKIRNFILTSEEQVVPNLEHLQGLPAQKETTRTLGKQEGNEQCKLPLLL